MFFVSICLNDLWIDFKWIVDGLLWSYIDYVGVVLLDFLVDCSTYIVFVDLNWLALGTSRFLLMFQWFFLLDFVRKLFIKFIWMDVLWDFKLFIVVFQCVFVQWILRCCVFNLLSFWYLLRWHCFILLVLMKLLSAYGSLMIFLLILHMISIDGKVPCQYKCVNCMKVLAYLTQPVSQVVSWKKDDVFFHTSIHPLD